MDKTISTKKNAIYNTVGSCFYLACQWLITVVVIRFGSVENGGLLTLAMSVTNVFHAISVAGRHYQVSDYTNKYQTGEYVSTRYFSCVIGLVLCLLYCFLYPGYSRYERICIVTFMLFKVVEALSDEYQAIQQTAERMDYIFRSFLMRGVLLLLSFSFILYFTKSLLFAILGMTITTGIVVLLYDIPVCRRLREYHVRFQLTRSIQLLKDNIPLVLNALFMVIYVMIPRTLLNTYYGNYTMGVYGSISAPAAIIQNVAVWLFLPFVGKFTKLFYERKKKDFNHLHYGILLTMIIASMIIIGLSKIIGEWLLNMIYGASIAEHAELLAPTLLTTVLIALEYYYSTLLTVARKLKYIVLSNIIAIVATLTLSGSLVRNHGSMGVNYSIYISMGINLIVLISSLLVVRKQQFCGS